jgi:nucleotide-binding universal stress UspA family protein
MENEEQQEPALAHAKVLARHTRATVILAWLVPVLASEDRFFSQIQVEPGSSGAERKERGEAFLAHALTAFQEAEVSVETRVVVTPLPPEQAIVELAVDDDTDLIIMATLSESAVGRFLFGSVAEKVRRRSPIPVLFVTRSQAEERGE